jgi:hypothetical protein
MSKVVVRIYRKTSSLLGLLDELPISVLLIPCCLWVWRMIAFREANDPSILQVWYHLIDRHFTMFHAEFEDGLFISVLKNRAPRDRNLQLGIVKFFKKSSMFKGRPPTSFQTVFFNLSCAPAHISNVFKRSKVMEIVSSRILLTE